MSSIGAVPRINPVGAEDLNSGILVSDEVGRFVLESGHSTSRGVIIGFDPQRPVASVDGDGSYPEPPLRMYQETAGLVVGRRRSNIDLLSSELTI